MQAEDKEREIVIAYEQGSLVIEGWQKADYEYCQKVVYDKRTLQYRAPAYCYRELITKLMEAKRAFKDEARQYESIDTTLKSKIEPRPHQSKALKAWEEAGYRGLVSLPTGAGKTILAVLCMALVKRSTLVVVPTIDLLNQWQVVLRKFFSIEIGAYGGGEKNLRPITVATYDSARLIIERYGHKFGFLVFDECHHLPAPFYQNIAYASLAPYRIGLSATLERADGGESVLFDLLGPLAYSGEIKDMSHGGVLAPYDVVQLEIELSQTERIHYEKQRAVYLNFVKRNGINFSQADGWKQFIIRSSRSKEGKLAMAAYRDQKRLAQAASGKLQKVWELINAHGSEATIIFTDDNAMAYLLGNAFILPVLTHKTKAKERKRMLESFRSGELKTLVTSKVLNEGVDVPEARVGIVVSGSGAVREHVQRLGRILRHSPGKRAVLYELVSKNTSEQSVNNRRRQHSAYQRSD